MRRIAGFGTALLVVMALILTFDSSTPLGFRSAGKNYPASELGSVTPSVLGIKVLRRLRSSDSGFVGGVAKPIVAPNGRVILHVSPDIASRLSWNKVHPGLALGTAPLSSTTIVSNTTQPPASAPQPIPVPTPSTPTPSLTTAPPTPTAPSATAAPPATTAGPTTAPPTAVPPTTTPPPTTAPPATPIPSGGYGAGSTGPGAEPCSTAGTPADSSNYPSAINNAAPGSTVLIRGGTYGSGFSVPQGVTVKPYNCESVQINDDVSLASNVTIAGLRITASTSDGWTIWILAKSNITIRNSVIKGGRHEAIRIEGTSSNILITGSEIDGGQENHSMKVLSQNNGSPTNIAIVNNRFTKTHFGGGEDLLQLENHGAVLVDHNTFSSNPSGEDGLDIKTGGGVTIRANLFEGVNINAECLMVAGNAQTILVQGNKMVDCTTSLGAGYDQMPTWTFRGNLLINTRMQLRRSANAIIDNNTMQGGHVQMGTPAAGDVPKNVVFTNQHYSGTTFHAWPGATWTPSSYGAV